MNPLIVHHGSCPDGFGSAWWLARNLDGRPVFHEGFYGQDPPWDLVAGRDVWIVDFSYPGHQLDEIARVCKSLIVFDHHQSAIGNLAAS
jgi:hypothetical protein